MDRIQVRNTRPADFPAIIEIARRLYTSGGAWKEKQLESHLSLFPDGQFVAVDEAGTVIGMAATLIIRWDDYHFDSDWREHTGDGTFSNHDPFRGRTLYGTEIMVDPLVQGFGAGLKLSAARRKLASQRGLLRIRAAAPLRGYRQFKDELTPNVYLEKVLRGKLEDRTLSVQLRHGFEVLAILRGYLPHDADNLGCIALIEWRNPAWSPDNVRLVRAICGSDYVFRTSMQHVRGGRGSMDARFSSISTNQRRPYT